ncbi:fibronectin type III domain-containing protein [Paenibacillus polysaccharolyticus]|uniref:fibronectin type III domain-containing protein n=1 Tax=Paenibacillus polysaccharolyticus TaxID=582692 RepID=UPI00280A6B0E|nr:fibronectin type III domain-containing protein [Paenibacillus polysaccharolyticus]
MKSKSFNKIGFLFGLLVLLSFGLLHSNASAASVSDILTSPETGWNRYDDTHAGFKYNGTFRISTNDTVNYNGTMHWVSGTTTPTSVEFKFKGTKLRVIGARNNTNSSNLHITIDGATEKFSQYKDVPGGSSTVRMTLDYEKVGLSDTVHTVVIANTGDGNWGLDAIDFNEDGYLINSNLGEPVLIATAETANINLIWTGVSKATGYNIKRAISSDGPYQTIATNVTETTYSDVNADQGVTYYYVVTANNADGESAPSNVASATLPVPETGRAILVVTMTTGLEKEFDLSMQEVNSFINWYETKQAGSGKASYAIDKHDNNKGPFKSRKDYVLFDRILTFEVSEY